MFNLLIIFRQAVASICHNECTYLHFNLMGDNLNSHYNSCLLQLSYVFMGPIVAHSKDYKY